jgi:uncharacterized RDD family membrane protein YckC
MSNGYYILEDGEQKGPFTFKELTEQDLDIHTSIQLPETETWQEACYLEELYPYFEARGIYFPTGDNLASFGWRLMAFIIDNLVLSFIIDIVIRIFPYFGITYKLPSYSELFKLSVNQMITLTIINSVVLIVYNSICEASAMKGSIGKRVLKMVVVDADGMGQSFLNALLRSVGKALSIFFFYLGFLSIFFTEHRQAVHDLLAKTYVVKRD